MGIKMGERRGTRRQKSFLRGFVYFDKMRGVMSCLVRDLCDDGARIILSQTIIIPDVVKLHIPQREQTWHARVRWRRSDELGLAFADENPVAVGASEQSYVVRHVGHLERKIAIMDP